MTKYELMKGIAAGGVITEEMQAKAEEIVAVMEGEAIKRQAKAAEKRAEKLEAERVLEDAVYAVLGDEPMTASDIKDAVEAIATPQKATVIVKRLVAAGLAEVQDVKGKSGKVKGYTRA